MLNRQELFLDPERILEFHVFLEDELLLPPAFEILVQFEIHHLRHIDAGLCQRLTEKALGFSREGRRVSEDPRRLRRVVEADGVFRSDIGSPVERLLVIVLGLRVEFLVDLLAGRFRIVRHLEQLGCRGGGVSGAQHEGCGPVLDCDHLVP